MTGHKGMKLVQRCGFCDYFSKADWGHVCSLHHIRVTERDGCTWGVKHSLEKVCEGFCRKGTCPATCKHGNFCAEVEADAADERA